MRCAGCWSWARWWTGAAAGGAVARRATWLPTGATALHAAVQQGHGGVVELLIAAGAPTRDLGGPRSSGTNVLLCDAARGGHEAVLAQLLAAGAAIDEKDFTGFVALTRAARNGHESAVALLLAAGAAVDVPTRSTHSSTLQPTTLAINGHCSNGTASIALRSSTTGTSSGPIPTVRFGQIERSQATRTPRARR